MGTDKKVLLIIMISVLSAGCLQEPDVSTSAKTPVATVNPTVTVTATQSIPAETDRIPLSYKVYVDDSYGFRRVIETTFKKEVDYKNLTLTINAGDTVEWVNDNDYKLTLISDQGLWTPGEIRAILIDRGFNYTFSKSGTYTFRIKEEPRIIPQTIIVKP